MKNLVDNIIDELDLVGISLLEDNGTDYDCHQNYCEADRDKVKLALSRALAKSILEE
jgi:hypothetical protein